MIALLVVLLLMHLVTLIALALRPRWPAALILVVFNNTTLRLLHRYVGPAHGTWQGHIPDLGEADALLAARGRELSLRLEIQHLRSFVEIRGLGDLDGVPLTLDPLNPEGCLASPEGPAILRVVPLDARALLTRCGARTEVWLLYNSNTYRPTFDVQGL